MMRKRYAHIIGFCLLLFFLSARHLQADNVFIIDPDFKKLDIGTGFEMLEDGKKTLTIDQVLRPEISSLFVMKKQISPSFGFTSSAYWVRFRVENRTGSDVTFLLETAYPLLDDIRLYRVDDRGTILESRTGGKMRPFREREVDYRNWVFRCTEKAGAGTTYILRVTTESSMNLSMHLWTPDVFFYNVTRENVLQGIYYGAILVMLIYNLFLFCSIRDMSYLFYVLYYAFFLMFQLSLNGLAAQYLWPGSQWWANNNLVFFILLSIIFALNFCRTFLEMERTIPRMNEIFLVLIMLLIIFVPFSFFLNYRIMMMGAISITFMTALLVSISLVKVLKKGFKPARFYAIAWSFFWVMVVLHGLKSFALIPDNMVTQWGMQASSFMEVVLISLGLADRINYLKKELESLNENLENIVEERTEEINSILNRMEKRDNELQQELDLAADIQRGILPQTPFYHEGIAVEAWSRSMGKVGGDFFDIFQMQGGHVGVLIADASGHGMPAAFITALAKISFAETIQTQLFPRDIFVNVNNELMKTIKTDDFVTAFFLVIGPTYEVFYGNASHVLPLVLRREGLTVEEWDTNGLFMGAMDIANEMYEDRQDILNFGDRVLLLTDGLSEAKNTEGESFGSGRLKNILTETAHLSIGEVRDRIMKEWNGFTRGTEQSDDVTLVIVEIDPVYRDLVLFREKGFKLLSKGSYDEAVTELEKALAIDASDEKTHLYVGECYLNAGNYPRAVEHLKEYLGKNEIDANVWCHLAEAYLHLRNFSMAYQAAQKALQFRSNFVRALVVSGLSLKNLQKKKEAYVVWKKLLTIDPKHEMALQEIQHVQDEFGK